MEVKPILGQEKGKLFLEKAMEIVAVGAVSHGLGCFLELCSGNVFHAKSDLLETGDLETLALLNDLDEVGGLHKGFMSARVEPGNAAAKLFNVGSDLLGVNAVEICDLQFSP